MGTGVVIGEDCVEEPLRQPDGLAVHELDGGRDDLPLALDPGGEVDGRCHVREGDQEIHHFAGQGKELQDDLRHHRQGPLDPTMRWAKSYPVASFLRFPPNHVTVPVGQHGLQGQHGIAGGAVLHHLVAPGVLRHVAAYKEASPLQGSPA